ncbi:MAG: hypothetical protein H7A47_01775 [Verrucomicrobiales bacterium]|nr:hypothetical protein [Verrucomicrobiales bacterium]
MNDRSSLPRVRLPDEEARRRNVAIRRGLARSNAVMAAALLVSAAFAGLAVFHASRSSHHAREAQAATIRANGELWNSQLAHARALRWSDKVGRRDESFQAIRNAVRLRPSPELRDEAIATLALLDVGPGDFWQPMPGNVEAVGFSKDLALYAWGNSAGEVGVFESRGRRPIGAFPAGNRLVMSLEFSPDNQLLAVRSVGGRVSVWNVAEARPEWTSEIPLTGYRQQSLQFHPGGAWLLAADLDGQVHVQDTGHWEESPPLPARGALAALCFNPEGSRLAVALDQRIEIWDFAGRRRIQAVDTGGLMTAMAWHPAENLLAAAHADGNLTLVDRRSGHRSTVRAHTMPVTRVLFDPRGEVLVSTSWDGTTRFWDARSGRPLLSTQAGYAWGFDATGRRLCYLKERLGVGAWDYEAAEGFHRLAVPLGTSSRILGVDFSPDGRRLAGTTTEGLQLWDPATGEHRAEARLEDAQRVAFAADNRTLIASSGSGFHRTRLVETESPEDIAVAPWQLLPGTGDRGIWLGFITQGTSRWLTAASPTRITALPLEPATSITRIPWAGPRRAATISPDGRFLATSVWKGGGTQVRDLQAGGVPIPLEDDGGLTWFRPDGAELAVGTATEFLFYDTRTWRRTARLQRDVVNALSGVLAYSADGRRIAVTHGIRQARLLDADTKAVRATLNAPHPERITDLAFSRDARFLAAATDNREIQLWDLERLQAELGRLGLAWAEGPDPGERGDDAPGANAALEPALDFGAGSGLWLSTIGVGLAGAVALLGLWNHRRLILAQAEAETATAENQRRLEAAQDQLLHSEKMRGLGTLAAGMAHDFNNLLSIIRMAGQLVRRELRPEGNARQNLEDIEQAAVQGKSIVHSILGYSRRPQNPDESFSVSDVVTETLAMLSRQFLSGIVLNLELAPDTPPVRGDKSRLEQVLLNLVVNASEAMGGQGSLALGVRARSAGPAGILPPRMAAGYVELTVRDSGPGIAPEVAPRIFEPFFSTKQTGAQRGTGLGLTTVYRIARQDGLGLDVETGAGRGSSFRVLIPAETRPDGAAEVGPTRPLGKRGGVG